MIFEPNLLSDILNEIGLLGRYAKNVIFAEFPVVALDSFGRQPKPCPCPCVTVVHEEPALLIPESNGINLNK